MSAMQYEQMELPVPGGTGNLKDDVLGFAEFRGVDGITVAEVREFFNVHHGRASSALSELHRIGSLTRLAERRERCRVYVVPDASGGRLTEAPGRARRASLAPVQVVLAAEAQGRLESLGDVRKFTVSLRQAILDINGNRAKRHDARCYSGHPECALRAVAQFIEAQERGLVG